MGKIKIPGTQPGIFINKKEDIHFYKSD